MSTGFSIDVALTRRNGDGKPFRLATELEAPPGITVLFGPSGAGKTTLMMAVLGALLPDRGRIVVDGRVLFDSDAGVALPVWQRRLGVVFQDALLFPHLTVRENVAFGLDGSRTRRRRRGDELLERVGAAGIAGRMPAELSGGERQRVALARALGPSPAALLLDEPFSALDESSRQRLGQMLVDLQRENGLPFLYVTHDVGEALRLGTRLAIIDDGAIVQSGAPAEVLAAPASAATARAVGTENLFTGTVLDHRTDAGFSQVDLGGTVVETGLLSEPVGSPVALGLRAEDILLANSAVTATSARNVIGGTVTDTTSRGGAIELRVATPVVFRVLVTPESARVLDLQMGRQVYLLIKAHAFHRVI